MSEQPTWLVVGAWDKDGRAHALVAVPGNTPTSQSHRASAPAFWVRVVTAPSLYHAREVAEEQVRAEYSRLRGA